MQLGWRSTQPSDSLCLGQCPRPVMESYSEAQGMEIEFKMTMWQPERTVQLPNVLLHCLNDMFSHAADVCAHSYPMDVHDVW